LDGKFPSEHNDEEYDPHKAALENSAYGTIDDESMYTSHPQHRVPPSATRESTYFAGAVSSSFTRNSNNEEDGASSSAKSSTLDSAYNYNDAYKNISKSVVSGTLGSGSTTKEEQETVCDEFTGKHSAIHMPYFASARVDFSSSLSFSTTVEAPKGKLGLILETSDEGCPVVQEIKPTSPLNGCVQVGDRLHSVDGRDVTMVMSATVSRVIASKQNSKVRKFVFARPQEHKVSVQYE
jgi:C-terminal processing protease CtpA/Prc